MDMSQYLQIFIEESNDHLQSLNEHLLELEHSPEDIQILNEIFRAAHTLKGMAGTMGFVKMQKLTHNVENVLSEIRSNKIKVNSDMLDILFQCLDALEHYIDEIIRTSQEGNDEYAELIHALERIINEANGQMESKEDEQTIQETIKNSKPNQLVNEMLLSLPEAQLHIKDEAIYQGLNVYQLNIRLAASCVLKSARAFVIFKDLEMLGEIIHSVPDVQDIEDERFEESFKIVLITEHNEELIRNKILSVMEVEEVTIDAYEKSADEEEIVTIEANSQETEEKNKKEEAPVADQGENNGQNNKHQVAAKSVRVNIERLDNLMNLVSELIIVKTQLEGIKGNSNEEYTTNYNDSIEYLERITDNLHQAVMKVRMVPVESVFNRFPRMIRDVSRKIGKDIDLLMSGEETELDRTVIDEIGDPLIHLLRNAADHGLETPEERKRIGKNPKGTIKLQAYQDGNSVVIEVIDDGKGIDAEKIKESSIRKGLISSEAAAALSEQEILEFLFKPGFSTSEKITDLSGRGVGLDVVKSKITALGGHVEVRTERGKGSRFIVRLPLTLAIIQALMVKIGDEKYAIPLNNIQNIEDVRQEEIKFVQQQEVIVLRNEVVPIIRLHKLLDLEQEERDLMMVVIVKKGEKQIGFMVDSLIGQQEIVIKPLGKYLSHINMIAGATILGNGEVALILDVNTLV